MLKRVYIENFQGIEKADIELGKFTVLVGESNHGKSSVIRSLHALISNPRGIHKHKSYWARKFVVSATSDLGTATLFCDSMGSRYVVSLNDVKQEYSKLNNTVPVEVSKILQISPESIDTIVSLQDESTFMLNDTGSQVSKILGSLTNIDIILSAVKESNKRKQQENTKLKIKETDVLNTKVKLDELKSVDSLLEEHNKLEDRLNKIKLLQIHFEKLTAYVEQIQKLNKLITDCEVFITASVPSTDYVYDLLDKMNKLESIILDIDEQRELYTTSKSRYATLDSNLEDLIFEKKYLLEQAGICPLCEKEISSA